MGRIKTTQIKRTAQKLVKENENTFKSDFTKNKKLVNDLVEVNSKKLRNVIAGYITRLVRQKEKQ